MYSLDRNHLGPSFLAAPAARVFNGKQVVIAMVGLLV